MPNFAPVEPVATGRISMNTINSEKKDQLLSRIFKELGIVDLEKAIVIDQKENE